MDFYHSGRIRVRAASRRIGNTLLSWLYPPRCPICEELLKGPEMLICPECMSRLVLTEDPVCMRCGRALGDLEKEFCENCERHHFSFSHGLTLLHYNEACALSLSRVKYHGRKEYLRFYGRLTMERYRESFRRMDLDGIVPVPLHPERARRRGYNQAEVLAQILGKELGLPVFSDALLRKKKTRALKTLDPAERLRDLSEAFSGGEIPEKGLRLLLVDDILTTGATLEACTRVLLRMGAGEVMVFAIAAKPEV